MNDVIGKDYIQKFIAKNVKTANYTKSSQNGMGNKDRLIRNLYIWAERQYDEKTTWAEIARKYDSDSRCDSSYHHECDSRLLK